MIENDTQYKVTMKAAQKFREAIAEHDKAKRPNSIHPRLWKATRDGMVSQLMELEGDIAAYETKKGVS